MSGVIVDFRDDNTIFSILKIITVYCYIYIIWSRDGMRNKFTLIIINVFYILNLFIFMLEPIIIEWIVPKLL